MITRKAAKMPEKTDQPAKTSHAAKASYKGIGLSKKKSKPG
jgi:hypothetical protein